jgi:hypothetical protein
MKIVCVSTSSARSRVGAFEAIIASFSNGVLVARLIACDVNFAVPTHEFRFIGSAVLE